MLQPLLAADSGQHIRDTAHVFRAPVIGVQKESLRFPKKSVLKNTVASGGADAAQVLHRLQQLGVYSSTPSQHSI
ncbi:MAG: hypothetical protein FRX49_01167 [Trebouxia sp. A1-2]|nr:MAG: hypothetical protein FRX49_01167 [Trebouxia sp. A1-2]